MAASWTDEEIDAVVSAHDIAIGNKLHQYTSPQYWRCLAERSGRSVDEVIEFWSKYEPFSFYQRGVSLSTTVALSILYSHVDDDEDDTGNDTSTTSTSSAPSGSASSSATSTSSVSTSAASTTAASPGATSSSAASTSAASTSSTSAASPGAHP